MDYKKILEGVVNIINTTEKSDIGFANICAYIGENCPELKESEDERIRKDLLGYLHTLPNHFSHNGSLVTEWVAWLEKQKEFVSADFDDVWETADCNKLTEPLDKYSKDAIKKMCHAWYDKGIELERRNWLEKQGEQKPVTDFSDLRIWKYIVDAVLTEKEGIGQYLDSPFTKEVAKKLQKRFGDIDQKSNELPNGDDYGIDSLWHAQRILEKTLGKVEGYQTDDGILEHKCAISAVKKLYEQKPAWSEEDETYRNYILINCMGYADKMGYVEEKNNRYLHQNATDWLKSLKSRVQLQPKQEWSKEDEEKFARVDYACLKVYGGDSYSSDWLRKFLGIHKKWKPSDVQMKVLDVAIKNSHLTTAEYNGLVKLREQLKKL